jgi:hypothetical protein
MLQSTRRLEACAIEVAGNLSSTGFSLGASHRQRDAKVCAMSRAPIIIGVTLILRGTAAFLHPTYTYHFFPTQLLLSSTRTGPTLTSR